MSRYFERKIDAELLNWAAQKNHKPLLLRGARQVGKSSAVRQLGTHFDNYVEVNLELNPEYKAVFALNRDPHRICTELSAMTMKSITAGKTLLFIDEIQESQDAISSLRFFYELYPELHVIAAGSLLEFALAELPSFGVGRIESLYMYPFSFGEYLKVVNPILYEILADKRDYSPLSETMHLTAVRLLREFMLVGSMPETVAAWYEGHDYLLCQRINASIVQTYTDDFSKYKKRVSPALLTKTMMSVAQQAGKQFVYNRVEQGIDSYRIKDSLELLEKAGLIISTTHTAANGIPLGAETNEKFHKYLLLDTGMMLSLLGLNIGELIIASDTDIVCKGALAEVFAGLEILKKMPTYMRANLYYWQNLKQGTQAEIDYLTAASEQIIPIEVKAGTKGSMQSLYYFLQLKQLPYGIRTSLENFGEMEKVKIRPLYSLWNM